MDKLIDQFLDAHDKRLKRASGWQGIIIHHTSIGARNPNTVSDELWKTLFKNITNYMLGQDEAYVSAHYHIGRFGECARLVDPDKFEAFHAGKSSFWNPSTRKWEADCNKNFIGIELLGDGNAGEFSIEQVTKCAQLCAYLLRKHEILNPNMVVGHEMVSPGRKNDPGRFFPWSYFFSVMMHDYIQSVKLKIDEPS